MQRETDVADEEQLRDTSKYLENSFKLSVGHKSYIFITLSTERLRFFEVLVI